jgi:hypothetical protein
MRLDRPIRGVAAIGAAAALPAHTPMVVLMTGYTILSLWILSQPIVAH